MLGCFLLGAAAAPAATPVPMASQPGLAYAESFADVANWAADFSSGTGANRFAGLPAGGSASIPAATRLTTASTNWASGSTGGKQKGSGALLLLCTGSSDNTTAVAVDFFLDFSGVDAGTLGFDWATVDNPTGNRKSSLRVYASVDGATFTELTGAQVLDFQNGVPAGGTVSGVALPASFHNCPTARLRFYLHNGIGGTTGNRPKLSLDNLTVTATAGSGDYPVATITNPALPDLSVGYSTRAQTFSGTCNTSVVGLLAWTNSLTGDSGFSGALSNWVVPDVRLGVGTNVFTLRATNQAGEASLCRATITRDMREFIKVMTANLTDRTTNGQYRYIDTSERIFKALRPDVVAIQEFLVTNASRRAYVDAVFGTNYFFSYAGSTLPNGVISRWPITGSGGWTDTQVNGQVFAWATIDLPGTQDLHVVSVHLKSGDNEATRKKEAAILTNEIRKAKWPASDFIVIAGDFNTPNRNDDSLLTLSNVVTDICRPVDQAGDDDTNLGRTDPYDYVLPNPLFNSCMVPLTLSGIVFPNGVVFDSRIWNPPPAPALTNDSAGRGGSNMQHMAVMKQFALLTCTDCDEDSLPDAWEIGNYGALTNASAGTDWDGDGFSDGHEYQAGTQPTNRDSGLFLKEPLAPAQAAHLVRWDSVAGKRYRVLRSTNLLNGFTAVQTGIAASAPDNVFTDFPPAGATLIYGVGLEP